MVNVQTISETVTHCTAVGSGAVAVVAAVVAAVLAVRVWVLRRRGLPTERTVTGLMRCVNLALVGVVGAGIGFLMLPFMSSISDDPLPPPPQYVMW